MRIFLRMLLNVFRDFPKENREKLQKHSKKKLKRFETISFLEDQKIELRTVGKRNQAAMQQLSLLNFWASASSTAADWGSSSSQLLSAENQRALWKFLFKTLSKSACRCIKLRNWENQSKKKLKLKLSTAETSFSCEPVFYERA